MDIENQIEIGQEDIKSIAIGRFEKQSQKESYRRFMGTLVLMTIGMFIYELNQLIGVLIFAMSFIVICFGLITYHKRRKHYIENFLKVWNEQKELSE